MLQPPSSTYGTLPPHLVPGVIPCLVPYWDQQSFLALEGRYSEAYGFHIRDDAYLAAFNEWLPRKWAYRGDPPGPVLLPDMLPESSWQDNLRTRLTDKEWDRLRRFCYMAAGNTCVACGSRGEPHVEAHEVWRFDIKTKIQTLRGLNCFCPTCHKSKHVGYANRMRMLPQVYGRLMWLNDWDEKRLKKELSGVLDRQAELSAVEWNLDLRFLRTYGVR